MNNKLKKELKKLIKDELLIIIKACGLKGNKGIKNDELLKRIIEDGNEKRVKKELVKMGKIDKEPSQIFALLSKSNQSKSNKSTSPNESSLKHIIIYAIIFTIPLIITQPNIAGFLLNQYICIDSDDNGAKITYKAITYNFDSRKKGDADYKKFEKLLALEPIWFNKTDNFTNVAYKRFCFCDKVKNESSEEDYNQGNHQLSYTGAYIFKNPDEKKRLFIMEGADVLIEGGKIKALIPITDSVSEITWVNAIYKYKWLTYFYVMFIALFFLLKFPSSPISKFLLAKMVGK